MDIHCLHCVTNDERAGLNHGTLDRELFHQPCSRCDSPQFQDNRLCDTCRHLRLHHLVNCLPDKTRYKPYFPLRKGLLENPEPTSCPICRIVRHVVLSYYDRSDYSNIGNSGYDLKFFLTFGLRRDPDISAVIHLEYLDDGLKPTQYITDVGALYMTDIKDGGCGTRIDSSF